MQLLTLIFIFGLCVGSFLNVLIYRLPRSLPLGGRSFCPKCRKKISWFDNIPLVSFIFLRGKCRFCHSPISWQYPLVELVTGLLTVFSIQYSVFSGFDLLFTIYYLLLIYALVVIFVSDLYYQIIPDQIVYPAIFLAILSHLRGVPQAQHHLGGALISGFSAAGFFFLLHLLTRGRGMGLGDVKLAFLMGLILGWPKILPALYLAFLTGAFVGVILILAGKKRFGQHIPFGPFLTGATLISLFWGKEILKWLTVRFF